MPKITKTSAKPIIIISHLTKKFGDFTAVNDVSFEVMKNEVFGILGPNGAGKTTTLEIIETLQQPTSGKIMLDGIDTGKNPAAVKRNIGVQLQSTSFYPELTLIEILKMFAALYDVETDPYDLLAKVQLQEKAKSFVKHLSGGQKQRFSIATTLINKPKVIFLDEPTTGLDPQARINLWEMIDEIKKTGVTIVLTTHYMDEAEELCDRLAIMDQGKIVTIGTPAKLIKDLLATGFKRPEVRAEATLEDVFLHLTGRRLRDA